LKGSIEEVRDQIKAFSTGKISKEFADINKVVDIANEKLDKFGKKLNGKKLSLLFGNTGSGRNTNLLGANVSGASGQSGRNGVTGSSAELITVFNKMNKAVTDLVRTMKLASLSISRAVVGGGIPVVGGGGRGGGGGGGGSRGSGIGGDRAGGIAVGGLGFSVVDAAIQIKAIFQDRRVKNAFSDSAGKLFGLLGGIFGDSVASIAGDIGKAFGEIGEIAFNILTLKFRLLGLVLAGTVKGIGVGLGIAMFSGFAVFTGGIGLVAAGALAVVTGLITSITSVIKELFEEALDIVQSLFKAAFSVISATIKTVITVFESVGTVITKVWSGLWLGLKGITQASVEGIKTVVQQLSSIFFQMANEGVKAFAKLEQGAIRGNKEIVDVAGKTQTAFADVARNISSEFGAATNDINELFFAAAGRGLLRKSGKNAVADFAKFAGAVARSAVADLASLNNVGNATISVMENYGIAVSKVTMVTELLNRTTTLGSTTMDELSGALANVLPNAAALGFELEDTLASVAKVTRTLGPGKAKNATRILGRLFEGLAIPTDSARKKLEEFGVTFGSVFDSTGKAKAGGLQSLVEQMTILRSKLSDGGAEEFRKIFPLKQARQAMLALTDDLETFKSIREDIVKIPITPQREFAMSGLLKRFQIIKATITNIAEKVIGSFLGKLLKANVLTERMAKLLVAIQKITTSKKFGKNFLKIGKEVVRVFIPLTNLIRRVVQNFGNFIVQIARGEFNNQIFRLAETLNEISVLLVTLGARVLSVENLTIAFDAILNTVMRLKQVLPSILDFIGDIFTGEKSVLSGTGDVFSLLFGFSVGEATDTIFKTVGSALRMGILSASVAVSDFIKSFNIGDVFTLGEGIGSNPIVQSLIQGMSLVGNELALQFVSAFQMALPKITALFNQFFATDNPIVSAFRESMFDVAQALTDAFQFGQDTLNFFQPLIDSIKSFGISVANVFLGAFILLDEVAKVLASFAPGGVTPDQQLQQSGKRVEKFFEDFKTGNFVLSTDQKDVRKQAQDAGNKALDAVGDAAEKLKQSLLQSNLETRVKLVDASTEAQKQLTIAVVELRKVFDQFVANTLGITGKGPRSNAILDPEFGSINSIDKPNLLTNKGTEGGQFSANSVNDIERKLLSKIESILDGSVASPNVNPDLFGQINNELGKIKMSVIGMADDSVSKRVSSLKVGTETLLKVVARMNELAGTGTGKGPLLQSNSERTANLAIASTTAQKELTAATDRLGKVFDKFASNSLGIDTTVTKPRSNSVIDSEFGSIDDVIGVGDE